MIKVEENYATEFYYLSLLWRYDHLKVQLCYTFLCGQYPIDWMLTFETRDDIRLAGNSFTWKPS